MNSRVTAAVVSPSPRAFSGRGFQLLLLTLAIGAGSYSQAALGPLQEAMRVALGLTDNEVALLQGPALGLPILLVSLPLGLAIDRRSRVRLLLLFASINLAATVLTAIAPNFAMLFTARCLAGLTAPAAWMAGLSLLADMYAPTERGRANMAVVLGQCAGGAAAFALGGALLTMSNDPAGGWRWAMFGLSAPLMPVLFATLAMREPVRSPRATPEITTGHSFAALWRYRALIAPLLGGIALVSISNGAIITWAAPMLARNYALAPDRIGWIMAVVLLTSGVLGPIVGGLLADHCQRIGGSRASLYALSALTLGSAPAGLYNLAPHALSVSALLFVFITLVGAAIVAGTTVFTVIIPGELLGLLTALLSAVFMLASLGLAPVTVSVLAGVMGGTGMLAPALSLVCVATSLLAAALFAVGARRFPRGSAA